jgi:hypothetical protein
MVPLILNLGTSWGGSSIKVPAAAPLGKNPDTGTAGQVGARAGLDILEKRKFQCL